MGKHAYSFLAVMLLVFSGPVLGQSIHSVISSGHTLITDFIQTRDGGYLISAFDNNSSNFSPAIIKLDSFGAVQWSKRFANNTFQLVHNIIQTNDGGYLLTGEHLIKLDSIGNVQWYRTEYLLKTVRAIQIRDGGYIIAGRYDPPDGLGYGTFAVIKLDASGTYQWNIAIDSVASNISASMASVSEGKDGYYVSGATFETTSQINIPFLTKLSNTGEIIWCKTYRDSNVPMFCCLTVHTKDNGFFIASTAASDLLGIKLDSNGNIEWTSTIDAFGSETSVDAFEEPSGDLLLTGTSGNVSNIIAVELTSGGNLKDVRRFDNDSAQIFYPQCLIRASDGTPVIAGTIRFTHQPNRPESIFITTLDESTCYFHPILVQKSNLTLTVDTGCIVSAIDFGTPIDIMVMADTVINQYDFCSFLVVDKPILTSLPTISLSPNPLSINDHLLVSIDDNMFFGNYEIVVRDLFGNIALKEEKMISNSNERIEIETSMLPSGIYTVELLDPNTFASIWHGKVVKIK